MTTNHSCLTAAAPLSKDSLIQGQWFWQPKQSLQREVIVLQSASLNQIKLCTCSVAGNGRKHHVTGVNGVDVIGRESTPLTSLLDRTVVCVVHQDDSLQQGLHVGLALHNTFTQSTPADTLSICQVVQLPAQQSVTLHVCFSALQ